jgi:hypothetical protein
MLSIALVIRNQNTRQIPMPRTMLDYLEIFMQ